MGVAYLLICNFVIARPTLLGKEKALRKPPMSMKTLSMGVIYSVVVGYFSYLFQGNFIFRLVGISVLIGLIKYFTKDKLRNAIIIYALTFMMATAVQVPIIILPSLIDIDGVYLALLGQILAVLIAYMLYSNVSLHKMFLFIKRNFKPFNVLALLIVSVLASLTVFHLFWSRDYIWALFTVIVATSVVVIFLCIACIMRLQLRIHDINNLLEGVQYLLKTEENQLEVYQHYDEALERNGFDISKHEAYRLGEYKDNIIELIRNKKSQHKSKAEVNTNIQFAYRHNKVSMPVMIQMLTILTDNAFETKTKKPIFVDMLIVGSRLTITVSNASDYKSPIEIDSMFSEGATAKKKGAHGYGLPSLAKIVKSYDGDITAKCVYSEDYKTHYLTLTLDFKED